MASEAPDFGKIAVNPQWKIFLARSLWHGELTSALLQDAIETLIAHGIRKENICTSDTSGSFELPLLLRTAFETGKFDGAIAFGVILEGATRHAELIARESARGCMDLQLQYGKPVTFEILAVSDLQDAKERCIGPKSKGRLAAMNLLHALAEIEKLRC